MYSEIDGLPILYWYPLNKVKAGISIVAYNLEEIYKDNKIGQIENVLKKCDIEKVSVITNQYSKNTPEELNLVERVYEQEAEGYTFPWYVECYYYDETKSWMIYVSHEGTITFTGEEIVRIAKSTIDSKYLV